MERVKTYQYTVVSEYTALLSWEKGKKFKASYSNVRLYATEQLALAAGIRDAGSSAVSIVVIEQLASLPSHQVEKLQHGLPWSSEIDSSQINLEITNEIEHPINR